MESDILKTTEYNTTYKTMGTNNADGYKNGDYIVEPYNGYDVKTYLCKYAQDSDTQISREMIAHSVYKKRDAVICKIDDSDTVETESDIGSVIHCDDDTTLP